jgi:Acetyltransferase (GNAT) domain
MEFLLVSSSPTLSWLSKLPAGGWTNEIRLLSESISASQMLRIWERHGTAMITQFVEFLFRDWAVTKIQTDPTPTNLRAIRCYEKVGFRKVGIVDTPDGSAVLMIIERNRKATTI